MSKTFNYKINIITFSKRIKEFIYKASNTSTDSVLEKMKKQNPYALCITVSCNNKHESQWINPNKSL